MQGETPALRAFMTRQPRPPLGQPDLATRRIDPGIMGPTRHFSDRFYDEGKKVHGPVKVLNPTTAYFPIKHEEEQPPGAAAPTQLAAWYVWRSRDNRKGRHAAIVEKQKLESGKIEAVRPTNTWQGVLRGLWKMLVRYPVWDVSYDVAIVFTIGRAF